MFGDKGSAKYLHKIDNATYLTETITIAPKLIVVLRRIERGLFTESVSRPSSPELAQLQNN